MPNQPTPRRARGGALVQGLSQQQAAGATSQQFPFADPTGKTGDPTRGHLVVLIGNLSSVGINKFGIASYMTGSWVQIG